MAKKEKNVKEKKQKSHYFKDMKAELKKVIWPSSKQTINNTMAVIVFTLIAAIIVFILDTCFNSLNKYAITPLQEKVQSSYQASHPQEETQENSTDANSTEGNETNGEDNKEDGNAQESDATNIEVENKTSESTDNQN